MKELYKEQTILTPHETAFRVESWLLDASNLNSQNNLGEFSVVFEPLEMCAQQMLLEHLEGCVKEVKLNTPYYSNKEARPLYENKKGFLFSSQLFVPKCNIEFEHYTELYGRTATISGHARDLPMGEVVLQIDYIDFDDVTNGIDEEPVIASVDDEDDW